MSCTRPCPAPPRALLGLVPSMLALACGGLSAEEGEDQRVRSPLVVFGSSEAVNATPGSGAYLDQEEVNRHHYDDINKILRHVPGVYVREEDGFGLFPNISLRGVDHGRSAKVSVMEDGILMAPAPYTSPAAYYSPTAGRMHAIEVLKGSSQVRYGPHVTGGVVNYVSTPIPEEAGGTLKTVYGEHNDLRLHAHYGDTVDLGSAGRVGYLFEGYVRTTEGFKHHAPLTDDFRGGETGFTNVEPMVKLMWEPDTDLYQRFEIKYGNTQRDGDLSYLGLSEEDFDSDPFQRYPATRYDQIKTDQNRTHLRHTIDLAPQWTLESTVYYNDFGRNWFKLHSVNGNNLAEALAAGGGDLDTLKGQAAGNLNVRANNRSYYSWGVQVVSFNDFELGATHHELEVGVRFHNDRIRRRQWSEDFTQDADGNIVDRTRNPDGSAGNRRQETEAIAVYLQDRITVGQWSITPGIRLERLDQEWIDFASDPTNTEVDSGTGSTTLVGGGVGATYDLNAELQFFGGVHRGFSPPGPRSAHRNDGLDEEISTAIEAGVRYRNEEHQFATEATLFYTRFEDMIAIENVGGVGSVDGTAENVGEIDIAGLELSATYDPGTAADWGFALPTFFALTYTSAELASDTGGDAESIFSGGRKGNEVPYVPEIQFSLGVGVEYGPVGVHLSANYTDEQFATASNTDEQERPDGTPDARFGTIESRFLVDVEAHYQLREQAVVLAGVQNLFDEEYMTSRLPYGPRPGAPRFAYVGLELDF